MKTLLLSVSIAIALFTISAAAQTTEPVLVKLPKAVNPAGGYLGGGTVQVRVAVDEKGQVTNAEFVSGPGAVCGWVARPDVTKTRDTAIALARQAKFTPATSGGKPIGSSTLMSIQFPVPKGPDDPPDLILKDRDSATGDTVYGVKGEASANSGSDPDAGQTVPAGYPGGLTGQAIALPKPRYPAAARAVRAAGAVQVVVLIDKTGNVFLAKAAGGHPLLQAAAVAAACGAKFTPVLVAGQPVKVSGIITYNFVP